jgi:hypothetical protein
MMTYVLDDLVIYKCKIGGVTIIQTMYIPRQGCVKAQSYNWWRDNLSSLFHM